MKARNIAVLALVLGLHAATISRAAVAEMEYFLGDDPGEGNGNILSISSPADTTASDLPRLTLSNNLAPGTHRIGIRVKDAAGRWSNPMFRRFTVYPSNFSVPSPSSEPAANVLVAAEYFVGPDPGAGRADRCRGVGQSAGSRSLPRHLYRRLALQGQCRPLGQPSATPHHGPTRRSSRQHAGQPAARKHDSAGTCIPAGPPH